MAMRVNWIPPDRRTVSPEAFDRGVQIAEAQKEREFQEQQAEEQRQFKASQAEKQRKHEEDLETALAAIQFPKRAAKNRYLQAAKKGNPEEANKNLDQLQKLWDKEAKMKSQLEEETAAASVRGTEKGHDQTDTMSPAEGRKSLAETREKRTEAQQPRVPLMKTEQTPEGERVRVTNAVRGSEDYNRLIEEKGFEEGKPVGRGGGVTVNTGDQVGVKDKADMLRETNNDITDAFVTMIKSGNTAKNKELLRMRVRNANRIREKIGEPPLEIVAPKEAGGAWSSFMKKLGFDKEGDWKGKNFPVIKEKGEDLGEGSKEPREVRDKPGKNWSEVD